MPFAVRQAEKYVKLDPPQWQELVYIAVTIHSHELPPHLDTPHSMRGAYSICAAHVSLSRATGRFQLAFRAALGTANGVATRQSCRARGSPVFWCKSDFLLFIMNEYQSAVCRS